MQVTGTPMLSTCPGNKEKISTLRNKLIYIGMYRDIKQIDYFSQDTLPPKNVGKKKSTINKRNCPSNSVFKINILRDHPFKTSALFRGGGVKNLPNLPMDSSKNLPTVGG